MENSRSTNMNKLEALTKSELQDMLERQNHLLTNSKFLAKLPDKGDKIRDLKARLERALEKRSEVDETAGLLQKLKLDQSKIEDSKDLDSDDDVAEEKSSTNFRVLGNKVEPDPFAAKLTQRMDSGWKPAHLLYHFRPNRDLESTKPAPRTTQKAFFETAVTPPPSKFAEAQQIPLKDAFLLQKQHEETMKELAIAQATEQLTSQLKLQDSFQENNPTQYPSNLNDSKESMNSQSPFSELSL